MTVREPETRLTLDDPFPFACQQSLECFTDCCRDVTIFLTPYDVLRMRRHVGLSSAEFLDRYTLISTDKVIPLVLLRMDEERDKRCPFVGDEGCSIYENRPWACRMYPLDPHPDGGFRLVTDATRCHGLRSTEPGRVRAYLESQDTEPFEEAEQAYAEITQDPRAADLDVENPQIAQMVLMATYNLDKFRDFVLKSSFLKRFYVEPSRVEQLKKSDEALLRFGYDWLAFGLYGKVTLQVLEQAGQEVARKLKDGE